VDGSAELGAPGARPSGARRERFPAIPKDGLDPSQYFGENEAIRRQMQEQFTGRAVAVLGRAGLNAWRNSADPISPLVLTPLVDSINSSNLVRRLPRERS
jgi:hypothetical protein